MSKKKKLEPLVYTPTSQQIPATRHPLMQNPDILPLIGQQQRAAQQAVQQAVQQLSISIYTRLACDYLLTASESYQHSEPQELAQLAKDSLAAAKAYFEGLGIATFQPAAEKGG